MVADINVCDVIIDHIYDQKQVVVNKCLYKISHDYECIILRRDAFIHGVRLKGAKREKEREREREEKM